LPGKELLRALEVFLGVDIEREVGKYAGTPTRSAYRDPVTSSPRSHSARRCFSVSAT
jgi:hypothetical protein